MTLGLYDQKDDHADDDEQQQEYDLALGVLFLVASSLSVYVKN